MFGVFRRLFRGVEGLDDAAFTAAAAVAGGGAFLLGEGDLETGEATTGLRVLTLVTLRLTSEVFAVGPPFFFPRCEKNMMQKEFGWSEMSRERYN